MSIICPGMTDKRKEQVLLRLNKIYKKSLTLPKIVGMDRRNATTEQKNIMSNLNILYKEMIYGQNYRDYVNNQGKERRNQMLTSTPAPPPPSTISSAPPPRSLSTPALTDDIITPISCFNVPEGYSLQYGHTNMKIEYDIEG